MSSKRDAPDTGDPSGGAAGTPRRDGEHTDLGGPGRRGPASESIPRHEDFDGQERTRKIPVQRRGPDRQMVFFVLRVMSGSDMLRFATLSSDEDLIIGRDVVEGHLVLTDGSVSRNHARVSCDGGGRIVVTDLGSTNGTSVNGQPITTSALQQGDHLEIGAVSLRLDLLSLDEIAHQESVLARLESKNRDPLTGLLSRAWLDEELPKVLENATRKRTRTTCLFVDLDHFKQINDRFGHAAGDNVLSTVARLLMMTVRDTDSCLRSGGEEILVFLQAADEALGVIIAERARRSIQEYDWTLAEPGLQVTASIGVAELRDQEGTASWIQRADRALYAAKAGGRNLVVAASSSA